MKECVLIQAHTLFRGLYTERICGIIPAMFGETGENPVRARRREAQVFSIVLPDAANPGQAIGVI